MINKFARSLAMGITCVAAVACGGTEAQLSNPETGEACDQPGSPERPYMSDDEYDAGGCTRTERMAKVHAFRDLHDDFPELPDEPRGANTGGDLSSLGQAVNIPPGLGLGITVDGFGQVTGNTGHCTPDPSWTTARPLIGNCVVPKGMNRIHWEVDPGYGISVQYMRDRARNAFANWSRSITCGNTTKTPKLQTAANSEQPLLTNEQDRYATAAISIFAAYDSGASEFMGRAFVEDAYLNPRTPIRNGIRYWEWQYMPIGVNSNILEGIKADACLSPNDPNRALKIQRAYEWTLTHEFGHTFGLPHLNDGVMRQGSFTNCEEVYNTAALSSRNAMTATERMTVADTLDASSFIVHNTVVSCDVALSSLPSGSYTDLTTE